MDPADQEPRSAPVQQAVTQQGILLGQHDANIRALISANQTLAQQVASLSAQLASLQAPAAPTDQRNQPETGDDQQRDLQAKGAPRTVLRLADVSAVPLQFPPRFLIPPGGPPPNSASRAPESPSVPTPEEPMQVGGAHLSQRNGIAGSERALIDSGAEENFIDEQAAEQAGIPSEPLERPPQRPRSGRPNPGSGYSPHTPCETCPVWQSCRIYPAPCHLIPRYTPHHRGRLRHHIALLSSQWTCLGFPPAYHDLQEVFNKDKALSLPPHRPYDCAIELLPDAPLPSSRLYNLTRPEQEAMEGYINDSMAAGIIRPSTSPVGAGFFFVKKKDSSLRPCIDFRGLNNITVKNKYPLPLIDSAFTPLQGATIFTKLDLRNAYHLVRIREGDEWKTAFNTPLGHFEYLVMPFGLTNAPAVFQALINDVLRDFLNRFVFVYLGRYFDLFQELT
ncbi:hypothetical protein L3Q82_025432 [Scortum barcoo]|uniref:Uncharacterized protein n=1 Tax=Scortum barcoo TaxID=214431 RepID=A0ACB8WNK1_9TELE|nr:hypothetical protein L3Q82_025432 [Scortum barcoo]